jgi:drug/metabolite transporter (DMT)-like permease
MFYGVFVFSLFLYIIVLLMLKLRIAHSIWLQYLVLFFGILCIAWSAIFVKLADTTGLGSGFYRMFIGTLGILPLWYFRRRPLNDLSSIKTAVLCGLFFGCDIALWNTSIMLSKAAISTLLANLAPVWVGLGAIFILKESPKKIFWIGTLLSLIGVITIVGFGNVFGSRLSLGNILAICASMFYGAYLLTTRKGRSTLDTVSFTAISMITSTVVLFVFCLIAPNTPLTGFSAHSWMALIALGLISQLGGWLAINFALGYIKPTAASVSLLSQSVVTALLSIPILGEYLSWNEVFGAFIVLMGIYLVNRKPSATRAKNVEPEFD